MASQNDIDVIDRKLQIIVKEWDHIQNVIRQEIVIKERIRALAITAFSALCGISFHQQNNILPLAAIPVAVIFWYMDAIRQAIQNIAVGINNSIEEALENPTNENIKKFKSPTFGREFSNNTAFQKHKKKAMFRKWRSAYYGSMIFGAICMFALL